VVDTDEMLIHVAKTAVEAMGRPSVVQTGPLAFPLDKEKGENASMPVLGSSL